MNHGPYAPLKVYLAGPFESRGEILHLKEALTSVGVYVTSTWLTEHDSASMDALKARGRQALMDDARKRAIEDFKNIDEADYLVLYKPVELHRKPTTGGHHVEVGYAQAKGKPVIIFGERENVFHYRPGVTEVGVDLAGLFEALGVEPTFKVIHTLPRVADLTHPPGAC